MFLLVCCFFCFPLSQCLLDPCHSSVCPSGECRSNYCGGCTSVCLCHNDTECATGQKCKLEGRKRRGGWKVDEAKGEEKKKETGKGKEERIGQCKQMSKEEGQPTA